MENNTDSWEERLKPKVIVFQEKDEVIRLGILHYLEVYWEKLKPLISQEIKLAHDSGYQKGREEERAELSQSSGVKLLEDSIRQEERNRIIQVIEELATRLITCHEDRTDSYDDAAQYGHEKALEELKNKLKR